MRLKLLLLTLLTIFSSKTLLCEENNTSKGLNSVNNIPNTSEQRFSDNVIIHVVKKGDTLSSLSKRYSIKKELIIQANNLLDENYIYVGQNLKIVEDLLPEKNAYKNNQSKYHEIKKGDNLTEIAKKYNLTLNQLIEINNIDNPDIVQLGTKLNLTLKESIFTEKDTPIIEPKDQIGIETIMKENKYGPLLIRTEKTNIKKRKKILEANLENGKRLLLQINCEKREINVRGIGRKWKGWVPAKELFEEELLNDFC